MEPIPATRTSVILFRSSLGLPASLLALCLAGVAQAQTPAPQLPASAPPSTSVPDAPVPVAGLQTETPPLTPQQKAEQELKQQEQQRIVGVVPNFNVSYNQDAAPLSRKQKLHLAWRTATDPVAFVIAGFDAGLSQAENDFPGYGQGAQGYAKRFGASYADNFDGTMLGNAIFPILLKQDPRYFRRGQGSFSSRFFYALSTTVWCKNDNGSHGSELLQYIGEPGRRRNLEPVLSGFGSRRRLDLRAWLHRHRVRGIWRSSSMNSGRISRARFSRTRWRSYSRMFLRRLSQSLPLPRGSFHFKSMTTIRPSD